MKSTVLSNYYCLSFFYYVSYCYYSSYCYYLSHCYLFIYLCFQFFILFLYWLNYNSIYNILKFYITFSKNSIKITYFWVVRVKIMAHSSSISIPSGFGARLVLSCSKSLTSSSNSSS